MGFVTSLVVLQNLMVRCAALAMLALPNMNSKLASLLSVEARCSISEDVPLLERAPSEDNLLVAAEALHQAAS